MSGQTRYLPSSACLGFSMERIRAWGLRSLGRMKRCGGFENSGANWTFGVTGFADSVASTAVFVVRFVLVFILSEVYGFVGVEVYKL